MAELERADGGSRGLRRLAALDPARGREEPPPHLHLAARPPPQAGRRHAGRAVQVVPRHAGGAGRREGHYAGHGRRGRPGREPERGARSAARCPGAARTSSERRAHSLPLHSLSAGRRRPSALAAPARARCRRPRALAVDAARLPAKGAEEGPAAAGAGRCRPREAGRRWCGPCARRGRACGETGRRRSRGRAERRRRGRRGRAPPQSARAKDAWAPLGHAPLHARLQGPPCTTGSSRRGGSADGEAPPRAAARASPCVRSCWHRGIR